MGEGVRKLYPASHSDLGALHVEQLAQIRAKTGQESHLGGGAGGHRGRTLVEIAKDNLRRRNEEYLAAILTKKHPIQTPVQPGVGGHVRSWADQKLVNCNSSAALTNVTRGNEQLRMRDNNKQSASLEEL